MDLKKTKDSSPYLRILCFNENKTEITSYDLLRSGYPAIIKNISDDGKKIICDRSLKQWKGLENKNFKIQACQRWIGFYFDGNYDRLKPDTFIKHSNSWKSVVANDGAYCDIQ